MAIVPNWTRLIAMSLAAAMPCWSAASADTTVDLELVLAVDVSLSMDEDEQQLQRDGFVSAFRDKGVIQAIKSGPHGRIAVTYVEWGGKGLQKVQMPWRVIASQEQAHAFADELALQPFSRDRRTSISSALHASGALFDNNGIRSDRRVIDVSGDGPNNDGSPVVAARDALVAKGITVNGLAIQLPNPNQIFHFFDLPDLDKYFSACVTGGTGSFVIPIKSLAEFATAIRQKLLLEIAGLAPGNRSEKRFDWAMVKPTHGLGDLFQRAEFSVGGRPTYDCLIGEKKWEQFSTGQLDLE
jgi:hypothetical protein